MELKLLQGVGAVGAGPQAARPPTGGAAGGPGFAKALDSALKGVSQLQQTQAAAGKAYGLGFTHKQGHAHTFFQLFELVG